MKKALEYFIVFIFSATLSYVVFSYKTDLYKITKNNIVLDQKEPVVLANNSSISELNEKLIKNLLENAEKNKENEKNSKDNLIFFSSVVEMVKGVYVEEVNEDKAYENAINGVLSSLDPHSSFLNEKDFKETQLQTKGEFGGLGIVVTKENNLIKVISPIEDTPAFRANVLSGDYIGQIGDESTYNMSLFDAVERMRGRPGERVKITILRKGMDKPIVLDLRREVIKTEAVKGSIKGDNVIYLRITNFIQSTKADLLRVFGKLSDELKTKNRELGGVVLDLRSNPGGLLDQAIKVSELFLEKDKVIVSIKGKNGILLESLKSGSQTQLISKEVPLIVLINEGSASASEIVAAALQDYKRAILLGKKTFGKASVQQIFPLKNGTALKITIARYYTPNGRALQADGIEPDIYVSNAEVKFLEDGNEVREKDLKGHLTGEAEDIIQKTLKEEKNKEKKKIDEELSKDYQLSRAIDLIKGINYFNFPQSPKKVSANPRNLRNMNNKN